MTPDGSVSTIHVFTGGTDGTEAAAALIQARDGDLDGTTQYGGPFGGGTVFRTTLDGTLTVLHAFHAQVDYEGGQRGAALVEGRLDGDLYGTTTTGGRCLFCGTIFRLSPDGTFAVVYSFEDGAGTGIHPFAALIQGREGNFYGTTSRGGTVFQITPEGELTVLHVFAGDWDGSAPQAALLQATDGAFYGTATGGGPSSTGTVFRVTADGTFDVIYTFPGSQEGASPSALIEAADGNLYGIALAGGTFNRGTVFQMLPDGTPTALHAFSGDDGASPSALIQADDGTFYAITTPRSPHAVAT